MKISYTSEVPLAKNFKRLYDTTGWGPIERDESFYQRALQGSWFMCCGYAGDQLVGFGRVISDGGLHAFITEMIIAPEFQGNGLGRNLLDRLVAHCLAHGVTDIQLFCAEGKADFYVKGGFTARAISRPGMQYVLP